MKFAELGPFIGKNVEFNRPESKFYIGAILERLENWSTLTGVMAIKVR